MTKYKLLSASVFLGTSALVVGCTQGPFVSKEVTNSVAQNKSISGYGYEVSSERLISDAFISMPAEAGEVISVTQRNYGNGASQRVIFRSGPKVSGENHVLVRATKYDQLTKTKGEKLITHSNELAALKREFTEEFPGRRFSVTGRPGRNAYGTFGHIYLKNANSQNCIFAWQSVRSSARENVLKDRLKKEQVDISLRFRFCGNRMSETVAIAAISRMKIHLDPADLENRREFVWANRFEDTSYLTGTNAYSAAYKSAPK